MPTIHQPRRRYDTVLRQSTHQPQIVQTYLRSPSRTANPSVSHVHVATTQTIPVMFRCFSYAHGLGIVS
jgi:hypothetical protein